MHLKELTTILSLTHFQVFEVDVVQSQKLLIKREQIEALCKSYSLLHYFLKILMPYGPSKPDSDAKFKGLYLVVASLILMKIIGIFLGEDIQYSQQSFLLLSLDFYGKIVLIRGLVKCQLKASKSLIRNYLDSMNLLTILSIVAEHDVEAEN